MTKRPTGLTSTLRGPRAAAPPCSKATTELRPSAVSRVLDKLDIDTMWCPGPGPGPWPPLCAGRERPLRSSRKGGLGDQQPGDATTPAGLPWPMRSTTAVHGDKHGRRGDRMAASRVPSGAQLPEIHGRRRTTDEADRRGRRPGQVTTENAGRSSRRAATGGGLRTDGDVRPPGREAVPSARALSSAATRRGSPTAVVPATLRVLTTTPCGARRRRPSGTVRHAAHIHRHRAVPRGTRQPRRR